MTTWMDYAIVLMIVAVVGIWAWKCFIEKPLRRTGMIGYRSI